MAIEIIIRVAGIAYDFTDFTDFSSISITDTQEVTGDTMRMSVRAENIIPSVGNEVIVTDGSTKEFGGIITTHSDRLLLYA